MERRNNFCAGIQTPRQNAIQHPYSLQASVEAFIFVRERQCWQKGHKKCRGRSTVTVPSKKKAVTTNVGGASARRGLGVKLSKREKQWPGPQEGMFVRRQGDPVAPCIKKMCVLKRLSCVLMPRLCDVDLYLEWRNKEQG
jgi:hypothetical protein